MRWFGPALIAALLLLPGCASVQRSMMYFPDQERPAPADFGVPEMEPRAVETADGLALHSWWRPPLTGASPTVVFFHGNAGHIGHRADKARIFLDRGYGLLLAGYRYNGGTGGSPGEEALLSDAHAVIDFVRAQGVADRRIVIYGESLGTGPAVAVASKGHFAALVLETPYDSMVAVASRHYWYLPVNSLLADRYDSLARIGGLSAPLLILHGTADRVIPIEHARRLYAAAPDPKEAFIVEGGGHNDLYERGAGRAVVDFLVRRVESAS